MSGGSLHYLYYRFNDLLLALVCLGLLEPEEWHKDLE